MAIVKKNPFSQLAFEKWCELQNLMTHALPRTIFMGERAEDLYMQIKLWHETLIDYCNNNCKLCKSCHRPTIDGLSCSAKAFLEPCEPYEHEINWDEYWANAEKLFAIEQKPNGSNTNSSVDSDNKAKQE